MVPRVVTTICINGDDAELEFGAAPNALLAVVTTPLPNALAEVVDAAAFIVGAPKMEAGVTGD